MLYALIVLAVIGLLAFRQFYAANNYLDPKGPFFSGNYAIQSPGRISSLAVISYNIAYGRNIEQALMEIRELESKKTLDIILLQEMDETGTQAIARELQLNYVYFPATIEPKYRRRFWNAVLSRWPIIDSQKLILPHISLSDRMKRVAVRAIIRIEEIDIQAYSIHTEPVFIWPKHKQEQCTGILNNLGSEAKYVIVGGDFNSFTQADVEKLERPYLDAGFVRASKGNGSTFMRFGMKLSPDQIFAKGFVVEATGKLAEAEASDHLPLWVHLRLQPGALLW